VLAEAGKQGVTTERRAPSTRKTERSLRKLVKIFEKKLGTDRGPTRQLRGLLQKVGTEQAR
jgi:hypothetical protein